MPRPQLVVDAAPDRQLIDEDGTATTAPPADVSGVDAVPRCRSRAAVVVLGSAAAAGAFLASEDGQPPPCSVMLRAAAASEEQSQSQPSDLFSDVQMIRRKGLPELCAQAAGVSGHTVPCPDVLPAGGSLVACAGTCTVSGGFRISHDQFRVPVSACSGCAAEVSLAAAPVGSPAAELLTTCNGARSGAGHSQRWICPPRITSSAKRTSYVMHRGTRDGIVYAVKVHAEGVDQAALLEAIVGEMRFVRPEIRGHARGLSDAQ